MRSRTHEPDGQALGVHAWEAVATRHTVPASPKTCRQCAHHGCAPPSVLEGTDRVRLRASSHDVFACAVCCTLSSPLLADPSSTHDHEELDDHVHTHRIAGADPRR